SQRHGASATVLRLERRRLAHRHRTGVEVEPLPASLDNFVAPESRIKAREENESKIVARGARKQPVHRRSVAKFRACWREERRGPNRLGGTEPQPALR